MTRLLPAVIALVLVHPLLAQESSAPRIEQVRIGFQPDLTADAVPGMKVGLWAPVYVTLAAGKEQAADSSPPLRIQIETRDSEEVGTLYTLDAAPGKPGTPRTFLAYTRTGNLAAPVTIRLLQGDSILQEETRSAAAPPLGTLLAVTLGAKVDGLQQALDTLYPKKETVGVTVARGKFSAHETVADFLPKRGLGYDAADLVILCTGNADFVKALSADPERLGALSQYVRGGGHLVVSLAPENQRWVHDLLDSPAWQPPLPVLPPAKGKRAPTTAPLGGEGAGWGLREGTAFPLRGTMVFGTLGPAKVAPGRWEVLAKGKDGQPITARMPYGLGHITLLAFSLESKAFISWEGREQFLKGMVLKLTTKEASLVVERAAGAVGRDSAAALQRSLDQFDIPNLPFGLVALLMVLYILFAGPLDYVLLRYGLRNLEWTWLTFPTLVILVSAAALFLAQGIKGQELKVNQVDLLDIDLRTDLDEALETRKTYILGQSFFMIQSPRNASYDVGLEPNSAFLKGPKGQVSALTWLGRPDREAWGLGRGGAAMPLGKTGRSYKYGPGAARLHQVPIPIWTTKAFRGSWEMILEQPPVTARLFYHQKPVRERDVKVSGTFRNNLAADLLDVWLIVGDRSFQRKEPIRAGEEARFFFESHESRDLGAWVNAADADGIPAPRPELTEPPAALSSLMKPILFYDKVLFGRGHNHLLRGLDQSWRLESKGAPPGEVDPSLREVIVFARLRQDRGPVAQARDRPSRLLLTTWDGGGPGADPAGTLTHDTYIRLYLPLYPADK